MAIEVRPFTPDDYEGLVAVENAAFPDYPSTADEWRYNDDHRDPKLHWERHVVDGPAGPIAYVGANHSAWAFDPRKLWVHVCVHPDQQGQGVGKALYGHIRATLDRFDPVTLWSGARQDYARSRRFLEDRGFSETQREWESHLDLTTFDPKPYEARIEAVRGTGIELRTLSELRDDPDHERKLYELADTCGRDVPSPEAHTAVDFDTWVKRLRSHPNRLPDGYVVALDGDAYVGMTNIWGLKADPASLETGLTGVRREYRRRGIALALKVRSLAWAKEAGFAKIKTWNETGNEGMLGINIRLGFVRQPAWIDYALHLNGEPGQRDTADGQGA